MEAVTSTQKSLQLYKTRCFAVVVAHKTCASVKTGLKITVNSQGKRCVVKTTDKLKKPQKNHRINDVQAEEGGLMIANDCPLLPYFIVWEVFDQLEFFFSDKNNLQAFKFGMITWLPASALLEGK